MIKECVCVYVLDLWVNGFDIMCGHLLSVSSFEIHICLSNYPTDRNMNLKSRWFNKPFRFQLHSLNRTVFLWPDSIKNAWKEAEQNFIWFITGSVNDFNHLSLICSVVHAKLQLIAYKLWIVAAAATALSTSKSHKYFTKFNRIQIAFYPFFCSCCCMLALIASSQCSN